MAKSLASWIIFCPSLSKQINKKRLLQKKTQTQLTRVQGGLISKIKRQCYIVRPARKTQFLTQNTGIKGTKQAAESTAACRGKRGWGGVPVPRPAGPILTSPRRHPHQTPTLTAGGDPAPQGESNPIGPSTSGTGSPFPGGNCARSASPPNHSRLLSSACIHP